MQPDVALEEMYKELYPFSEIVGNSNVLIMPSQHSAAISYKMIKSMSRAKVIGPLLIGLGQPIEIAPLRSSTSEIINLASIAAYSADVIDYKKINFFEFLNSLLIKYLQLHLLHLKFVLPHQQLDLFHLKLLRFHICIFFL